MCVVSLSIQKPDNVKLVDLRKHYRLFRGRVFLSPPTSHERFTLTLLSLSLSQRHRPCDPAQRSKKVDNFFMCFFFFFSTNNLARPYVVAPVQMPSKRLTST